MAYVKTEPHRRALSNSLKGNRNRARHGHSTKARRSPEHVAWTNMLARCRRASHPSFARYGGRGISVCERWSKFENFLSDLGPRPSERHSLERVDNNRGYEPGNCRWATRSEQQRNTRRTRLCEEAVAEIRVSGESISALARKLGVDRATVRKARDGVTWS